MDKENSLLGNLDLVFTDPTGNVRRKSGQGNYEHDVFPRESFRDLVEHWSKDTALRAYVHIFCARLQLLYGFKTLLGGKNKV